MSLAEGDIMVRVDWVAPLSIFLQLLIGALVVVYKYIYIYMYVYFFFGGGVGGCVSSLKLNIRNKGTPIIKELLGNLALLLYHGNFYMLWWP